ncbi:recombinase family protein [Sphingomonas sp. ABOLE]|nr:recombinase family protein [Sphingomonas sp. ABOLE]
MPAHAPAPERNRMRTVIYARYSSQLQNSRSIEGQLADCRDRCAREGWTIVAEFQDAAISGAKGIDEAARPGLNAMLAAVEAGGIDQVLADSTSRIARRERDSAEIHEILAHANCRLFTLADGVVQGLTASIKAAVDAQQRRDLAHNIRRGQRTSVLQGRAPAGIAYGYRRANRFDDRGELVRGIREVDEDKAEIVRRIFAEFAAGRSPQAIAEALNAEGVPGPRGAHWSITTIRGDRKRQNGMLVNRIYVGELVVGRTAKLVNPRTGSTVIRPIAEDQWQAQQKPELRIVDQEVWDAVQDRIANAAYAPYNKQQRPKHILSGLGQCGSCGSGYIRISGEKWGCSARKNGKGCDNGRIIETKRYLSEVQHALKNDLLHPDLVAHYERVWRTSRAERISNQKRDRTRVERRLAESSKKLERLAHAIANGAGEVAEIVALAASERKIRDEAKAELAQLEAMQLIPLLPGLAEQYRRQIDALHEALEAPEASLEAVPKFRALIHRIVLTPNADGRGVLVQVEGRMDQLLSLATGEQLGQEGLRRHVG